MTDGNEQKLRIASEQGGLEENSPAHTAEMEGMEKNPELHEEATERRASWESETSPTDHQTFRRKPKNVVIPQVRDEVTVKIEKILEEGVGDAYARLSPIQKQEFKLKGEEVARAIREMVKTTHFKVKKIFRLILDWLKMLPGVNRFFLEQEAKIKTDRIIALAKEKR